MAGHVSHLGFQPKHWAVLLWVLVAIVRQEHLLRAELPYQCAMLVQSETLAHPKPGLPRAMRDHYPVNHPEMLKLQLAMGQHSHDGEAFSICYPVLQGKHVQLDSNSNRVNLKPQTLRKR